MLYDRVADLSLRIDGCEFERRFGHLEVTGHARPRSGYRSAGCWSRTLILPDVIPLPPG